MLEAYTLYEAGLCQGCGQPLAHTSQLKHMQAFEVSSISCHACEMLENISKGSEAKPGAKRYVTNWMSDLWRRP